MDTKSARETLSRRDVLKTLGLGALALGASQCGSPGTSGGRDRDLGQPNIIFIMVDDLGPEWVGCYGSEETLTPNVDALARGGMRFDNVYSMPKCTPTRASLLTGQYPFRTGWINHWDVPRWGCGCHFDPNHNMTFARLLKEAGYATAAAGKWQINDFRVQPDAMARHGFDEWCMWTGYETGNPPSAERYADPYIHTRDGSRTVQGGFGDQIFTDFVIDFMKRHRDGPMMVYYPMCLTHGPLTDTPLDPGATGKRERFAAMVRYTDHLTGRIVAALDELGIRDNTIVIWTTDNGSPGGMTARTNGREVKGGKGKLTENGPNAPFVVNGPGLVPAGRVTPALSDFTDMLPTFVDLAGATLPAGLVVDGCSIADLILGRKTESDREWIMAMGGGTSRIEKGRVVPRKRYADRVLRDKRFKLWIEDGSPTRLFDLAVDRAEDRNLIDSDDPEICAARSRMEAAVARFPEEDGAPLYDPVPPQAWDAHDWCDEEEKEK